MRYRVGNVTIACPCCQHDRFDKDYRQLNTKGATFFKLDWANRDAILLICKQCSYLSWFLHEPEVVR